MHFLRGLPLVLAQGPQREAAARASSLEERLKPVFTANLERVRNRMADLGADPSGIRIVAATKGRTVEEALAAFRSGIEDLGENYSDEFMHKAAAFSETMRTQACSEDAPGPRWHFIGNLQSNKVRRIAGSVSVWQSVWRRGVAAEIARRAPGASVLLQVSSRHVAGRGGCLFEEAPLLLEQSLDLGLSVKGLMTMALPGPPGEVREEFGALRRLADSLELPVRSMGISSDWELAVAEGSNMVRLGKTLFEQRPLFWEASGNNPP